MYSRECERYFCNGSREIKIEFNSNVVLVAAVTELPVRSAVRSSNERQRALSTNAIIRDKTCVTSKPFCLLH